MICECEFHLTANLGMARYRRVLYSIQMTLARQAHVKKVLLEILCFGSELSIKSLQTFPATVPPFTALV